MTPERWARVQALFQSALKQPAGAREVFLERACADDPTLVRDVQSLVNAHEAADSVFDATAVEEDSGTLTKLPSQPLIGRRLGPYEILSPLGAGGMGEVYRARDTRLGREVAVKVLPDTFSRDPDRLRRFEQEARAAGSLNHPNILTVYDVGTHEGVLYIVFELLEERTLRDRLRDGTMGTVKATHYAIQIARALAAAHERGIVHRDLKPENVFLTAEGAVKILDFGLAKQTASGPASVHAGKAEQSTGSGVVLGTVGYMSPEQIRGGPVDHRSDVFSLGAVLYEMFCGRRAFEAETAAETLTAILREEPPDLPPDRRVPVAVEGVVRRGLAKQPADRFPSARDVASALETASDLSTATTPSASADTVGGNRRASRRRDAAAEIGPRTGLSLAVLPFTPLGLAADQEYLGLGMADALITRLGNIRQTLVQPTSAVRAYVHGAPDPLAAGRSLGVDMVLEGSLQRAGDRIRVTVQLVSVHTSGPIWGQHFDESVSDIFSVQDSISERLVTALLSNVSVEEKRRLQRRYTEDHQAHLSYLRGRYHWNKRTKDDLQKAVTYFQQAIERDADYPLAHAGLADCYTLLGSAGYAETGAREVLDKARAAALRALELDDDLAEAHTSLAPVKFRGDWDWAGAEQEFRRAIATNPGYASAHHHYAMYLSAMGRSEEALAAVGRARELDPLSLIISTAAGRIHYYARDYDGAIDECLKTLEMDPRFAEAHINWPWPMRRSPGLQKPWPGCTRRSTSPAPGLCWSPCWGTSTPVPGTARRPKGSSTTWTSA